MAEATRRIAHFSYIEEVDVTALEDLRAHLNTRFAGTRPKLTVLPFIVRAMVVAVGDFPHLNALYDDEREVVMRHADVHAGIATQTPSGLMVPVLRHAEAYDLWNWRSEIKRLADAARDGSVKREELSGPSISITSLGDLGGIATTPVINRPRGRHRRREQNRRPTGLAKQPVRASEIDEPVLVLRPPSDRRSRVDVHPADQGPA